MKHNSRLLLFVISIFSTCIPAEYIHKTILSNGLTVLVRKTNTLQKVSTQLWVNVGSKHEKDNERGLAHWLEHMIFKGTTTMAEADLQLAVAKLSGVCNAATSYDSTRFFIDLPLQHWHEALPILADCMQNCTFKQDRMDAEVQVVIQELKMYKDHFGRALSSYMMSSIFQEHPYHHPIIGYKNNLRQLHRESLIDFYKKYYIPNNALLVIVGNVDPEKTIELVEKYFGSMCAKTKPNEAHFSHALDICSQNTTLYRPIQQPIVRMSYIVPGYKVSEPYIQDVLQLVLTGMPQSRLVQLLVDEHQLANWIYCENFELFDYDLFAISFEPKQYKDVSKIIALIEKEIDHIKEKGISNEELAAAARQVETAYYSLLESNHAQAQAIATGYLARQDENFAFENYVIKDPNSVKAKVQEFVSSYLRPSVMHTGVVLPLPENEKQTWNTIQQIANKEDAEILKDKQRNTELEKPSYSITLEPKKPAEISIPQPEVLKLDNGLTVYYYNNPAIPKINIILQLKANKFYETDDQRGIFSVISNMLQEGTHRYSQEKLNKELSKYAINMNITPGCIFMDMLAQDFPKAFELLEEVVARPKFDDKALKKIKSLLHANIRRFWDSASNIANKLLSEYFYDGHPFAKNYTQDEKSLERITRKNLVAFHRQYFTPHGASLIIVGNLKDYNIPEFIQQTIAHWKGPEVVDIAWPEITPNTQRPTSYHLEREQIILALASLSVARTHPDFYKLQIFDQVLKEKLFSLREQSGAFYTISGSLLYGSTNKQPGLVCIMANVSQTRIEEAEDMIRQTLPKFIASFNEDDLEKAKLKLLNSPIDLYSTNSSIASAFAFLHSEELPFDYYAQRNDIIEGITVDEVKEAVTKLVDPEKLVAFKVGRLT